MIDSAFAQQLFMSSFAKSRRRYGTAAGPSAFASEYRIPWKYSLQAKASIAESERAGELLPDSLAIAGDHEQRRVQTRKLD
jgi:hypothetical protein